MLQIKLIIYYCKKGLIRLSNFYWQNAPKKNGKMGQNSSMAKAQRLNSLQPVATWKFGCKGKLECYNFFLLHADI